MLINNGSLTILIVNPINSARGNVVTHIKKLITAYREHSPQLFLLRVTKSLSTYAHRAYYATDIH